MLIDNKKITEKIQWFTISYISNISEKFKNIVKVLNVKLSFFSFNKLGRIVKAQKDFLSNNSKKMLFVKSHIMIVTHLT